MFSFFKKSEKAASASALSVRLGYILGGFLGLLLLFQMLQLYELRSKLQFIDGLQESQSAVLEQVGVSQSYLTQFAMDLNQIREFLLLPATDYDFSGLSEVEAEAAEPDLTVQIFDFVEALGTAEAKAELYEARSTALRDYFSVSEDLINKGVSFNAAGVEGMEGLEWNVVDEATGTELLSLVLSRDALFSGKNYYGTMDLEEAELTEVQAEIRSFMSKLEEVRSSLAAVAQSQQHLETTLFPSEGFQTYLNEHALKLSHLEISNADGSLIAQFEIDALTGNLSLKFGEKSVALTQDEAGQALAVKTLEEQVDPRTALQVKVDERRDELAHLALDRGFNSTLESLGLSMGAVTEEATRLYYPILNDQGEVLRNLVLDFATGEVSVEMPGSGEVESLAAATLNLTQTGKKKLSTYLI